MTTTSSPAASDAQAATPPSRLLQLIHELTEGDMGLVRQLYRQAHAQIEAAVQRNEPAPDFTLASERMSRSVRRSIMLADQMERRAEARAAVVPQLAAARRQVIRVVEDSIQQETAEQPERLEQLESEFLDRLDMPEFEDDLAGRPVADIIAEIRHDLGLGQMPGTHPWKRRKRRAARSTCPCRRAGLRRTGCFHSTRPIRLRAMAAPVSVAHEPGARPHLTAGFPAVLA